jgi:hypothetical protein
MAINKNIWTDGLSVKFAKAQYKFQHTPLVQADTA